MRKKRVGIWKYYFENGQLEKAESYETGILINKKEYFINGQLKLSVQFDKNEKTIKDRKEFYSNGQLKYIERFENGLRTGRTKYYFDNGSLHTH
ncbi:toxin-antitoxin system YwqK family antitoxin [Lacinutrix salivirga]